MSRTEIAIQSEDARATGDISFTGDSRCNPHVALSARSNPCQSCSAQLRPGITERPELPRCSRQSDCAVDAIGWVNVQSVLARPALPSGFLDRAYKRVPFATAASHQMPLSGKWAYEC